MMKKIAQRIYRFSLSMKDSNYDEVRGIIENLIGQGALSRVIRDGIRLVNDLSSGRIDVLLELYPWITEAICPKTDSDDMEKRIADMVAARLEGRMQQQGRALPDGRDTGLPLMSPPFKHSGTLPAAPAPVINAAAIPSAGAIADNFMASLGF